MHDQKLDGQDMTTFEEQALQQKSAELSESPLISTLQHPTKQMSANQNIQGVFSLSLIRSK